MNLFLAAFAFGIVSAAVIAIAAVGFTLQFAITNFLNVAFGGVMTVSAYVVYVLNQAGLSVWLGLIVSMAVGAGGSYLLYRLLYGPFRRRQASAVMIFIVSLAAEVMIVNVVLAIAGTSTNSLHFASGPLVGFGQFRFSVVQLAIIGLAVILMVGVHLLLRTTRLGKAMRATATNFELAKNSGIRAERVIGATWLVSGALCGIAGTVFTMNAAALTPGSIQLFLIVVLAAAVVGGIGSPYGAMAGAVIIGLLTELAAAAFSSEYKNVFAFIALTIVLLWRPEGIFVRSAKGGT